MKIGGGGSKLPDNGGGGSKFPDSGGGGGNMPMFGSGGGGKLTRFGKGGGGGKFVGKFNEGGGGGKFNPPVLLLGLLPPPKFSLASSRAFAFFILYEFPFISYLGCTGAYLGKFCLNRFAYKNFLAYENPGLVGF